MKRLAMLLALMATTLAMVPVSHAVPLRYTASLSGPNEAPPNASAGTGTTIVDLDTAAHTLHVNVVFSGLSAATTASHIHCCVAPNGTAGVATTTPTFAGFPLGVTSGSFDAVFNTTLASTWNPAFITANGGTPLSAEATLAAGLAAGQAYLNVHTTLFPAGEIRGFLVAQVLGALGAANIPTLSGWALLIIAVLLAVIGSAVMRKRAANGSGSR